MKTYMTPEEHARLHRRRARQTLGLLIAVLALVGIVTVVRAGVKGVATLFDDTQQKAEYEDRLEGLVLFQSFGTLEFAGESEPVFERDKNNRRVLAKRSYNLYSDVQKGENVVVEIPVQAGEKKFKYEQKVKLVNPKLYGRGYAIGDMGHTDYVLLADDIVAVEEK